MRAAPKYPECLVFETPNAGYRQPEKNLLGAIVWRAVQDYFGNEDREAATEWLFEDRGSGPFTFGWICDHLSLDRDRLRSGIRGFQSRGGTLAGGMCPWNYRRREQKFC